MLALTSLIWGAAFIAQSAGSEYMSAYTFNGIRFIMGGIVLLPVIFVRDRLSSDSTPKGDLASRRTLYIGGIVSGALLCLACNLQQIGISMGASAGKASFLTSTYIVIVPILEFFVFKKKIRIPVWIGVALAMIGLYMMCLAGMDRLVPSDIYMLLCAVAFAVQIIALAIYAPKTDPIRLSAIEFFVCGAISAVIMVFCDIIPMGLSAWSAPLLNTEAVISLLYAGILSSGVAYTLQVVAEKHLSPSVASLIFSTEAVFAAVCGLIILNQKMSKAEIIGSAMILLAVIISQLELPKKNTPPTPL